MGSRHAATRHKERDQPFGAAFLDALDNPVDGCSNSGDFCPSIRGATVPVLMLIVGLLLASCASAPKSETVHPSAPSRWASAVDVLPSDMAGFRRVGPHTDFESLPKGAGLGASAPFVAIADGKAVATVYLYDRGSPQSPEGAQSNTVARELALAAFEIQDLARSRNIEVVDMPKSIPVLGEGAASVACLSFRINARGNEFVGGAVCITVQQQAFVKVRLTGASPDAAAAQSSALSLMVAVLAARRSSRA